MIEREREREREKRVCYLGMMERRGAVLREKAS